MYNIAVCEDDIFQAESIKKLILDLERNESIRLNVEVFHSGELLLEKGYELYDIIILDIKMKKIDGIEIAKRIRKTNNKIKIIFITAIEKYWPEGYKVNAYRYIVKPIDEENFYKEIRGLIKEINKRREFILINHGMKIVKVLNSDILYLEIFKRKVIIHSKEGIYNSNLSLKEWRDRLCTHGFASPHNSYLVNMENVKSMDKEKVTLFNGEYIYISQRKYKEFKEKLIRYVGGL